MSFFKRKDKSLIPPVASEQAIGRAPSPAAGGSAGNRLVRPSATSTYNASRDGDSYQAPSYRSAPSYSPSIQSSTTTVVPPPAPTPSYSRSNPVGDMYSRGEGNIDQDRSALFAGYNPEKAAGGNRFAAGGSLGNEPAPGEENDEDVEGIKTQTRFVKQESVNSTRNALRLAREAEETARNTMLKLGDQSGAFPGHSTSISRVNDDTNQRNLRTPSGILTWPRVIHNERTIARTSSSSLTAPSSAPSSPSTRILSAVRRSRSSNNALKTIVRSANVR